MGRDLPRGRQPPAAAARARGRARPRLHRARSRATPPTCSTCLRHDLGLAQHERRFPRKGTCLAIYSRAVNAQEPLADAARGRFPWCREWAGRAASGSSPPTSSASSAQHVLDYDDLLLYWFHLMSEPALAARDRRALRSRPRRRVPGHQRAAGARSCGGSSPTAAASPSSATTRSPSTRFRAATVRNILDFPAQFAAAGDGGHARAELPLDAADPRRHQRRHRARARERSRKNAVLGARRRRRARCWSPCADEQAQVGLRRRRASSSSARRASRCSSRRCCSAPPTTATRSRSSWPAQHPVREVRRPQVPRGRARQGRAVRACAGRENPRDALAAFRVAAAAAGHRARLAAARCATSLGAASRSPRRSRASSRRRRRASDWPALRELFARLRRASAPWPAQMGLVRRWYQPHLERLYDDAARPPRRSRAARAARRGSTRRASASCRSSRSIRRRPPAPRPGPPLLDEDYLILSTIHSAKGQEWDTVFVLNAADGCIPSDMATGIPAEIEEERRLLYVAMTRAKNACTSSIRCASSFASSAAAAIATSSRRARASSPTRSSIASSASRHWTPRRLTQAPRQRRSLESTSRRAFVQRGRRPLAERASRLRDALLDGVGGGRAQ